MAQHNHTMSEAPTLPATGEAHASEKAPIATPVMITSEDVLRGQKAIGITHNGALYRLQTTRQGKLILTK